MKQAAKHCVGSTSPPAPLSLIHITQAYNRGEISLEEWLKQTRAWAELVIRHYNSEYPAESLRSDQNSGQPEKVS